MQSKSVMFVIVMHNRALWGGLWSYQDFLDGKPGRNGALNKFTDTPHGSMDSLQIKSGQVYQIEAVHTDPLGFVHHSVPNACIIP
jgi:hypothetical protein